MLALANRLTANRIKVVIDQKDIRLGARTLTFMERSVSECDRVLVICTEVYKERFDGRKGGADMRAISSPAKSSTLSGENEFIPVLRCGDWNTAVPAALSGVYGIDLRTDLPEEYAKLIDELGGGSAFFRPSRPSTANFAQEVAHDLQGGTGTPVRLCAARLLSRCWVDVGFVIRQPENSWRTPEAACTECSQARLQTRPFLASGAGPNTSQVPSSLRVDFLRQANGN